MAGRGQSLSERPIMELLTKMKEQGQGTDLIKVIQITQYR